MRRTNGNEAGDVVTVFFWISSYFSALVQSHKFLDGLVPNKPNDAER